MGRNPRIRARLRSEHAEGPAFAAEPYVQVFADRQPFVPNLSFADFTIQK